MIVFIELGYELVNKMSQYFELLKFVHLTDGCVYKFSSCIPQISSLSLTSTCCFKFLQEIFHAFAFATLSHYSETITARVSVRYFSS